MNPIKASAVSTFRSHLPEIAILAFALLILPLSTAVTTWDSLTYMVASLEFLNSGEFTSSTAASRPVFIWLLSLSNRLFGPSVWSALYAVRLFFPLALLVLYGLTRHLFGRPAALLTCLFLVTSYWINLFYSRVLLDGILPVFLFLGFYLTIHSLERRSIRLAAIAGSFFAIAYLTKEVTLLFLPFPVLVWVLIKSFREDRQALFAVLVELLVIAVLVLLWKSYASSYSTLGVSGASRLSYLFEKLFADGIFQGVGNGLLALNTFYRNYIRHAFTLWPFITVAWIYILYIAARKRNPPEVYLAIIFVLFLPSMLYLGFRHLRVGQAAVFYFASYMALSVWLWRAMHYLSDKVGNRWKILGGTKFRAPLMAAIPCLLIAVQVFGRTAPTIELWKSEALIPRALAGKSAEPQLSGFIDDQSIKLAKWIDASVSEGDQIAAFLPVTERVVCFLTGLKHCPLRIRTGRINIETLKGYNRRKKKPEDGKLLYLWVNNRVNSIREISKDGIVYIRYLEEISFLQQLKVNGASYIVLPPRLSFLSTYLDVARENFQRVYGDLAADYLVYSVLGYEPIRRPISPAIGEEFKGILSELRNINPGHYRRFKNNILIPRFGLTEFQVTSLLTTGNPGNGYSTVPR